MKKNSARVITLLAILLVVFSVIAFAIPFEKNGEFAVAYIFSVIAIVYQLYILKISFDHGKDAKSKFYGFPIARVGAYYLIGQLAVSVVEMALAAFLPAWVAIVINVILLAVVLIGCITAEIMRDEIERQDNNLKKVVVNMRNLQSLSSTVASMCEDATVKLKLQNLADEIKFSDPVSSEITEEIEQNIIAQMKEIQNAVIEKDYAGAGKLADKVLVDVKERNRLCAVGK